MGFVSFDRLRRRPGEAILRFAVAVLTSLLVLALAGLTVVEVQPSWLAGLRNAVPAPAPSPATTPAGTTVDRPTSGHAGAAGGQHVPASAKTSATTRTSSTVGAAGHRPRLVGLRPAAGAPGQHVTVTGVDLFSRNGRITLLFGKQSAQVRCASTRRCVTTVPHLGGAPRAAQVSLRTTSGISNSLTFHYR